MQVKLSAVERKMSETLRALSADLPSDHVTPRLLLERLGEQGMLLLSLIATIPFLLPVSIPGTSTPFGLLIALVGVGVALARVPYLPRFVLEMKLPSARIGPLLTAGAGLFARLERYLRPRWPALSHGATLNRVNGLMLAAAGVMLMAPLPIPLSNTFPGWACMLLALGIIERDGVAILAGYVLSALSAAYFALIAWLGVEVFSQLLRWSLAPATQPA